MKTISTENLLKLAFDNPKKVVEAQLLLKGFLMATHFMCFDGRNFYDEGIDGEDRKLFIEEFLGYYCGGNWIVNNVV